LGPDLQRQRRVDRLAALLLAGGGEILAGSAEKLLNLDIGAGALIAAGRRALGCGWQGDRHGNGKEN
jgi:hypothetical protein